MLRVGVVGCGYWGSKHLRVMNTLTAVGELMAIDSDERRLAQARGSLPSVSTCNSFDDAIERLDAIVLATPARTHAELGTRALDRGVSVLVEKPMATTTADARRLSDAAARSGATLMVGHTFEYNAAVLALRDLIRSGDLGDILYVDSARLNLGLYQSDVSVIWDLAPHDLSVINFLLDAEPDSVRAWGSRHMNPDVEDVAYIRLDYSDLAVSAQVHVSWLDPCKIRRVTVVGSRKMAVYNDLNTEEPLRVFDKGLAIDQRGDASHYPVSYRYGAIMSPYIESEEPLLVEDRHFLECVLSGDRPRSDDRDGAAVVRALEAADASIRSGQPISLAADGGVLV